MSKIKTNKIINPSVPTDVISGEIVDHIKGEQVGQITSNVKVLTKLFGQPVRHESEYGNINEKAGLVGATLKTTHSWNLRFFFSEIVDNTEVIALLESQIETLRDRIKRDNDDLETWDWLNKTLEDKETVLEQKLIQQVHQTQIDVEIYDYNNIIKSTSGEINTFLESDELVSYWSVGINEKWFDNENQERINNIVKTIKDLIRNCIESIDNNNEYVDLQITSTQNKTEISEKVKTESIGNLYRRFITDFGIPSDFHFDNGKCWWVRQILDDVRLELLD